MVAMTVIENLTRILEQAPRVRLAVLFGSAVKRTRRSDSDVDVGVSLERGSDLSPLGVTLERAAGRPVDLVWLDTAPPLLRFEIACSGLVLVQRDPHGWAEFRAHAMIDWWDWAPTARMMHQAMASRLREEASHGPVRREVVATKVGRARVWVNDAAAILLNSLDAFLSDPKGRDLSLFYLFLAVQECIDLAAHWVADEGWGEPDDAGSALDVLADRGVIDRETATALRSAAGLRNRIAHGYALLDYGRVYREAQDGIPALRTFLVVIAGVAGV